MPKNNSSVDVRQFNQMCRQFARAAGLPLQNIVDAEVAKVLDKAIDETKSAKPRDILNKFGLALFSTHPATMYTPTSELGKAHRRKAGVITKGGFVRYFLQNRYPNELWGKISARRIARVSKALASIGLGKKQWWLMGQALGLPVKGGRFTGAIARTGKEYPENISTRKKVTKSTVEVGFTNSQPTIVGMGGQRILQRATDGRWRYFYTNMAHGVFNSLKEVAAAYPGVKVTAQ